VKHTKYEAPCSVNIFIRIKTWVRTFIPFSDRHHCN